MAMSEQVEVLHVVRGNAFIGKSGDKKDLYTLADVDTPDKGESGYDRAIAALAKLIAGKSVSVRQLAMGEFDRPIVGVETLDGESVNDAMEKFARK